MTEIEPVATVPQRRPVDATKGTWVAYDEDGVIIATHKQQPVLLSQLRRFGVDLSTVAIEQLGYGLPPGTRVRLKGEETKVVSDDRWVANDAGLMVRNPGGQRVVKGIHSPDAARYGAVVGHEPSVASQEHPKHLVLMDDGTVLSVDFDDLEGTV